MMKKKVMDLRRLRDEWDSDRKSMNTTILGGIFCLVYVLDWSVLLGKYDRWFDTAFSIVERLFDKCYLQMEMKKKHTIHLSVRSNIWVEMGSITNRDSSERIWYMQNTFLPFTDNIHNIDKFASRIHKWGLLEWKNSPILLACISDNFHLACGETENGQNHAENNCMICFHMIWLTRRNKFGIVHELFKYTNTNLQCYQKLLTNNFGTLSLWSCFIYRYIIQHSWFWHEYFQLILPIFQRNSINPWNRKKLRESWTNVFT